MAAPFPPKRNPQKNPPLISHTREFAVWNQYEDFQRSPLDFKLEPILEGQRGHKSRPLTGKHAARTRAGKMERLRDKRAKLNWTEMYPA